MISKVDEKKFVGKDIIHVAVFDKNNKRTIYNMIYRDGKSGPSFIKRFNVSGVTRDKAYDLTHENTGFIRYCISPTTRTGKRKS